MCTRYTFLVLICFVFEMGRRRPWALMERIKSISVSNQHWKPKWNEWELLEWLRLVRVGRSGATSFFGVYVMGHRLCSLISPWTEGILCFVLSGPFGQAIRSSHLFCFPEVAGEKGPEPSHPHWGVGAQEPCSNTRVGLRRPKRALWPLGNCSYKGPFSLFKIF